MSKRATVLNAFWPRRCVRRVKREFRFCATCGAWTHGNVREHDTLCFAIETNVRHLASGRFLAMVAPTALVSSRIAETCDVARWPLRANACRANREGYEMRSARSQFATLAHYALSKPTKRSAFEENKALTLKLRALGYSDGEITLAMWSNYDQ